MLAIQREAIQDAERIVKATGNVGRRVSRLLTRLFNVGRFYAIFDVKAADILDAALFQSQVHDAVTRVSQLQEANDFKIEVKADENPRLVRVVLTPLAIPQGLRGRQALLRAFLKLILPIKAAAQKASDPQELRAMRRQFLDNRPTDIAERDIKELQELVRGNYTSFRRAGMRTLELAAVLNPEIDAMRDGATATAFTA